MDQAGTACLRKAFRLVFISLADRLIEKKNMASEGMVREPL